MTEEYFWGTTLSEEKVEENWNPNLDIDSNEVPGVFFHHTLFVQQIILGDGAKEDEVNIVEVETKGYDSVYKFPIAILKGGAEKSHAVVNLYFPKSPVLFRLVKGSGPIHLVGNHEVGDVLLVEEARRGEELLSPESPDTIQSPYSPQSSRDME